MNARSPGPDCRTGTTPGNLQLMSRHVAIVTDSTAYLPARAMERHGITAVPLTVVLGDRALEEGTEISTRSLAQALQKRRPVTTSRPNPELFAETYRRIAESGADGIVSCTCPPNSPAPTTRPSSRRARRPSRSASWTPG